VGVHDLPDEQSAMDTEADGDKMATATHIEGQTKAPSTGVV